MPTTGSPVFVQVCNGRKVDIKKTQSTMDSSYDYISHLALFMLLQYLEMTKKKELNKPDRNLMSLRAYLLESQIFSIPFKVG